MPGHNSARAILALAIIVTLAFSTAAADCLSQFGPGCTSCATLPTGNRRLLHGGWGRGGEQGQGRQGHNETEAHQGHQGHNETENHAAPTDFLTCTACDTTGYVLKSETRGAYTYGRCECAAGWGAEVVNSTGTDNPGHISFICVTCADKQVPLTPTSGVSMVYSNGAWSLVLGSQGSTGGAGVGLGRRKGFRTNPPPYYRGQCVPCPDGSAPNADSTACVANP